MSPKKFKKMKQDDSLLAYAMHCDGKTNEQIVARTGMPMNVVHARIKRGKKLWEQRLGAQGEV